MQLVLSFRQAKMPTETHVQDEERKENVSAVNKEKPRGAMTTKRCKERREEGAENKALGNTYRATTGSRQTSMAENTGASEGEEADTFKSHSRALTRSQL